VNRILYVVVLATLIFVGTADAQRAWTPGSYTPLSFVTSTAAGAGSAFDDSTVITLGNGLRDTTAWIDISGYAFPPCTGTATMMQLAVPRVNHDADGDTLAVIVHYYAGSSPPSPGALTTPTHVSSQILCLESSQCVDVVTCTLLPTRWIRFELFDADISNGGSYGVLSVYPIRMLFSNR